MNTNTTIELLYRGTNNKESMIELPQTSHEDYCSEGVGIYTYDHANAYKTMIYALSKPCAWDAEDEPLPLNFGYVNILTHQKNQNERPLNCCFPSECKTTLRSLLSALIHAYPNMKSWKPTYWLPVSTSLDEFVDIIVEQNNNMMKLYKDISTHISPRSYPEYLTLWNPLFKTLNSYYSLTENKGEVLVFDESCLTVIGHKKIFNHELSNTFPKKSHYPSSHEGTMDYIKDKNKKEKQYLAITHAHYKTPYIAKTVFTIRSCLNEFLTTYGEQRHLLTLNQQTYLVNKLLSNLKLPLQITPDKLNIWLTEPDMIALDFIKPQFPQQKQNISVNYHHYIKPKISS